MYPFARPITCSLSPNTDRGDVLLAAATLVNPLVWRGSKWREAVSRHVASLMGNADCRLYGSGRVALADALRAIGVGRGDEVVIQAFTCMVVANAVRATGALPVYADIDDSYNLNGKTVAAVLTPKTKAVIVQHTFGIPADMDGILDAVRGKNVGVIEDCAHGLGASYKGKPLGSLGVAAITSFGRDKAVSSIWGGALILRGSPVVYPVRHDPQAPSGWIVSQLLHPIVFSIALPVYGIGIGKALIEAAKRLGLVSLPVERTEKEGGVSTQSAYAYPEPLARLAVRQLVGLPKRISDRRGIAALYREKLSDIDGIGFPPERAGASYLRMPIIVDDPERLAAFCRKRGIYLGHWYGHVIDPVGSSLESAGYRPGSCPVAESVAAKIINLPTTVSRADADRVIAAIRGLYGHA
jgi:perosamine synthetase